MKSHFQSPFARKLKKLRIEHGISQKDLARELGISRSCLANYEAGKRQPDNDMLIHIADRFQVLVDYLIDRTDYKNVELSLQEIDECTRLKQKYQSQPLILDLSSLTLRVKFSLPNSMNILILCVAQINKPFLPHKKALANYLANAFFIL